MAETINCNNSFRTIELINVLVHGAIIAIFSVILLHIFLFITAYSAYFLAYFLSYSCIFSCVFLHIFLHILFYSFIYFAYCTAAQAQADSKIQSDQVCATHQRAAGDNLDRRAPAVRCHGSAMAILVTIEQRWRRRSDVPVTVQ